jgi:hypothetical protein
LFALYTVFDSANPPVYSGSILVKMVIDPAAGYPVYQAKVDAIAKNAQEIIYIESFGGDSGLFIPALGGPQKYDGTTNGVDSKLEMVRPFASGGMTKTTILTGDPLSAAPTTWDIRAFASPPDTGPTDFIFLLTGTMDTAYNQNWRLYKPTTTDLNKVIGKTLTAAGLKVADEGTGSPGNYWDVYYENGTGHIPLTESSGDRLWFFKGSPICVAVADGYLSSPRKLFGTGYAQGQIGGINVDSATLVTEAVKQAAAGVSLKRGLRGSFRIPRRKETEEKK